MEVINRAKQLPAPVFANPFRSTAVSVAIAGYISLTVPASLLSQTRISENVPEHLSISDTVPPSTRALDGSRMSWREPLISVGFATAALLATPHLDE